MRSQQLTELNVIGSTDDIEGKSVLSFEQWLWVYDYEDADEVFADFVDKAGFDPDLDTDHPLLIKGTIHANKLELTQEVDRHSTASKQLLKILKQFDLDGIVTQGYIGDNLEDFTQSRHEFLAPLKDKIFYHGTSLTAVLKYISKRGLQPTTQNTNFRAIKHDNKVFVTLNMERALGYAMNAAQTHDDFPVILKLKIPDVDKLVVDYDAALDLYGLDHPITMELGYNDIYHGTPGTYLSMASNSPEIKKAVEQVRKSPDRLNSNLGVFGYVGRIPAAFIASASLDEEQLRHWLLSRETGEEFAYTEQIRNVEHWYENTFEQLQQEYDNAVKELQEEEQDYMATFSLYFADEEREEELEFTATDDQAAYENALRYAEELNAKLDGASGAVWQVEDVYEN